MLNVVCVKLKYFSLFVPVNYTLLTINHLIVLIDRDSCGYFVNMAKKLAVCEDYKTDD